MSELTVLLVFLGEGYVAIVLSVKPLYAPADQVLPARLHGRTEQTGVQGRDLTWKGRVPEGKSSVLDFNPTCGLNLTKIRQLPTGMWTLSDQPGRG